MSTVPPVHLVVAALAEQDAPAAGRVLRRVAGALGVEGLAPALRRAVQVPDALVDIVAASGSVAEQTALAKNPCLTPAQLTAVIEAAGAAAVRAAFSPPDAGRGGNFRYLAQDGPEEAGKPVPEAVVAADAAPETLDPEAAITVLRDTDCTPERAVGLLRARPFLAHAARVPTADPALPWSHTQTERLPTLLQHLDRPWESVTAIADQAAIALGRGAVTAEDLCVRVAPALVGVQAMIRLLRSRAPGFPDKAAADAVVLPLLRRTVGADPHAWARLAKRLGTATVPLAALLAEVAAAASEELTVGIAAPPQEPAAGGAAADEGGSRPQLPRHPHLSPPAKARPALLFLIRRLPADDISALLPHFDEPTTADLIQGDAPVPADLLELAHATGNRVLLRKLAGHQHLRDAQAERIRAYDDVEFDRHLAWNRAGVTAALRREIVAGHGPEGRARRPMDPQLRQWAIDTPGHLEPKTLAFSGDPALVCLSLPKCTRLRRIDLLDIALSVWERSGAEAVAGVVGSVPEAFPAAVRKLLDAALASGSTDGLTEARARWDRGGKADRGEPEVRAVWDLDPLDRVRDHSLAGSDDTWVRSLAPADVVRWGRGAARALDVLPLLCADGRAAEVRAALAEQVASVLGADAEAWAVFAQLLPDFEGTLPELAGLAEAAAYRPEGAA